MSITWNGPDLDVTGTATADWVVVTNSDASAGTAITCTDCTDSGGNTNWTFEAAAELTSYYVPDSRLLMPELFEPGRKPSQQLAVNWNNSLTKGLKVCQIFQDKVNLADNRQGTISGAYLEANRLHFDGSNDDFTLDAKSRDAAIIGTNNFLIVAKAKYLSGDQDYPTIAHAGRIISTNNWVLSYDEGFNQMAFVGESGDAVNNTITLSDGEEHVYSVYRDGSTLTCFVDDEQGTTDGSATGNYDDDTKDLTLGSAETAEYYWKGDIDYFFLWVGLENPAEVMREILRDPYQFLKPAIDVPLALFVPGDTSQTVSPTGIATGEVFGGPAVEPGLSVLEPPAIATAEAFGSVVLAPGSVSLLPAGIASAEAHGAQIIVPGMASVDPAGIVSAEAFGTPAMGMGSFELLPAAIPSAEALGDASLLAGAVAVDPAGIVSTETFGSTLISAGLAQILAQGIASAEALGTATVSRGAVSIDPAGIVSAEAFGATGVLNGTALIAALGIGSAEAFGTLVFQPGYVILDPVSIGSAEAFGAQEIVHSAVLVVPPSITTGEMFGDALVIPQLTIIEPAGIVSDELFGTLTLIGGAHVIGWLIAEIQSRAALAGAVNNTPGLGADIRINWDG